MTISEKIKTSTVQNHQVLEKLVVGQIKILTTREDYIDLLGLFYSYFGALELLIEKHILPEYLTDVHQRRKVNLITQDLFRLGAHVPKLLGPNLLPTIKNFYRAFGALYVIEGSSLGGVHIAKMLRAKLPEVTDAFFFFECYGGRTSDMWNRFKSVLDNISGNQDEIDSISSGAQDTFLKFAEWINSNIKSKILI